MTHLKKLWQDSQSEDVSQPSKEQNTALGRWMDEPESDYQTGELSSREPPPRSRSPSTSL